MLTADDITIEDLEAIEALGQRPLGNLIRLHVLGLTNIPQIDAVLNQNLKEAHNYVTARIRISNRSN